MHCAYETARYVRTRKLVNSSSSFELVECLSRPNKSSNRHTKGNCAAFHLPPVYRAQNADYNRTQLFFVHDLLKLLSSLSSLFLWSAQTHFKSRKRFASTLPQIDVAPTAGRLQTLSSPGIRLDQRRVARSVRLPLLYYPGTVSKDQ